MPLRHRWLKSSGGYMNQEAPHELAVEESSRPVIDNLGWFLFTERVLPLQLRKSSKITIRTL